MQVKSARHNRGLSLKGALGLVIVGLALCLVVAGLTTRSRARAAGPGQYSAPEWFPLHRTVSGSPITVGCTYLSYGTQGGYECGGHHDYWALDLMAGAGTNIYPAGAGFARNVSGQSGYSGYGNVVVIDHGGNVKSLYAHMSQVLVSAAGAWVDQNTVIGLVGSTGTSGAPHLHFETTSSGRIGAGSRDPGELKACHGSQLVSYPNAWGLSTWKGIPWGTHTAYSDATACASPVSGPAPTPTPIAAPATVSGSLLQVERVGASSWQRYEIQPGATIVGAPAVVWDASGAVSVFAAGQDASLRQFTVSPTGWSSSVVAPAGTLSAAGGVSAVHVGAKSEVFAVTHS